MYSIKAVAQATGLSVETLRAWERRYGVVVPARDVQGRRVYRGDDVLRLRRLREATDLGHPIGRLVHLDEAALAGLLDASAVRPPSPGSTAFVDRMLDAAQRYSAAEFEQALTLAIALLPPARLIEEVLGPLLREVGDRWHHGDFSIAQERLVSSAVRRQLGVVLETFERAARKPSPIVLATLPGEGHELGLLMSALVCASRGFRVHYLGPGLPAPEIARYANETDAAVVALSVLQDDAVAPVLAQLTELRAALEPRAQIWVGGRGAQRLDKDLLPSQVIVLAGTAELQQRLDALVA